MNKDRTLTCKLYENFKHKKQELRETDNAIHARLSKPSAPPLVKADSERALWKINVPNHSNVFMSTPPDRGSDIDFIIFVDTEAFYRRWLKASKSVQEINKRDDTKYECSLRSLMPNDIKYPFAEKTFKECTIKNPIPITVLDFPLKRRKVISFSEGMTRTIWLIVNRAESFPILTNDPALKDYLFKAAGHGMRPICYPCLRSIRV